MASRLDLQKKLEKILGSRNVYFQPPESIKISYPAIIYRRDNVDILYANDSNYLRHDSYELTYIAEKADDDLVDILLALPYCSFNSDYVVDNLYHYIFTLVL
jgi:hypothetical protein